MLELIEGLPGNVVGIAVSGRLTMQDCQDVLVPAMQKSLKRHEKIRLYYELNSRFPGAAWDELDLGLEHASRCERVAIVTDIGWVRLTVKALRFLIPSEIRVFPTDQADEGRAWIRARPQPRVEAGTAAPVRARRVRPHRVEAIVTCACNLANCARTGANGCDRPLKVRSLAAFALFDKWAQLPGDGQLRLRWHRVALDLRLGGRQLALQRFDTPAPGSQLAPLAVAGHTGGSRADQSSDQQAQETQQIERHIGQERQRPEPDRYRFAIGDGEQDQKNRDDEKDGPIKDPHSPGLR